MLANIISAIGSKKFYEELFITMRSEMHVCQLVVHRFEKKPAHNSNLKIDLLAVQSDDNEASLKRINEYVERLHPSDPFIEILRPSRNKELIVDAVSTAQLTESEYRERLFSASGLAGKLTVIHRRPNDAISLSVYRKMYCGSFSANEITHLSAIGEPLIAALERHNTLKNNLALKESNYSTATLAQFLMTLNIEKPLSEREATVCAYILMGYSNLAISLNLELSIHTISTYRRRAYEKMNITSQAELFNLILKSKQAFGRTH